MSTTITLRGTHDAYTDEGTPNRNFGNEVKLGVNGSGGGQVQRTYVGCSLKAIPDTAIIKSALLHLYLRGSTWTGANVLTAHRITQKWNESKIKFSDAPTTTASNSATATVTDGAAGDEVEWDVTDMVADAVSGASWHGIRISKDTAGDDFFNSSEQSNHFYRPKLVVEYAMPPAAPSNLRPRGSHAVDAAQPKLAWDSESVSAVWVQVASDSGFTTDLYDSGWETATEPYWDLALATTPSFTALSDGDARYWRVKVKSEDGDASNYSSAAQFERHTYGTFSITSPAVDGDAVDETTPTIITSLVGRTQTQIAWNVYVRLAPTVLTPVQDFFLPQIQPPISTSDDTFEIHPGAVIYPTATYRVDVKVWDEYDRETAVGETAYVSDLREFVYDPSAGTTVVSALAGSQPITNSPIVRLSWTRAAAPDSYDVYIDDTLIGQHIDPGDVFVSGTSYQYDLYVASPRQTHTYTVVATENHIDSISNPTADFSANVGGIWIMAPDDGILLPLWGKSEASASLGETGTTYELLNRPTPVRIVDAIRGLEGSVSGTLDTVGDITVQDAYAAFIALKALDPGANIRLCFGPKNIPVILGEASVVPTPDPEERWEVSIEFWQSGEFDVT